MNVSISEPYCGNLINHSSWSADNTAYHRSSSEEKYSIFDHKNESRKYQNRTRCNLSNFILEIKLSSFLSSITMIFFYWISAYAACI